MDDPMSTPRPAASEPGRPNCFAALRRGEIEFHPEQIHLMRQGADLFDRTVKLRQISKRPQSPPLELTGIPAQRSTDRSLAQPADARRSLLETHRLVADIDRVIRLVDRLGREHESGKSQRRDGSVVSKKGRRVLVADDSLAVRDLQRKLLSYRGYDVEIAVDGVDAWNALRTGDFDLVLADIDMPLMGGIELIRRMRKEPRLQTLAAVVVCERDREQDRWRGFEAGADYYVIRGTFHDTLVQTVASLIGAAQLAAQS